MKQKPIFIAGCNPGEMDENGRFPCKPRFIDEEGRPFASERPVIVKINGREAQIYDDGDAPDFLLEKLKRHLQNNVL